MAITISAGLAISPGGLVSAARPTKGQTTRPISGTGASANAASSCV